jgi:hypothetical protein
MFLVCFANPLNSMTKLVGPVVATVTSETNGLPSLPIVPRLPVLESRMILFAVSDTGLSTHCDMMTQNELVWLHCTLDLSDWYCLTPFPTSFFYMKQ